MSRARFCLIFLTLACSGGATAAERPARASRDLLVLYTFERPEADQIIDRSGVGERD
jgi:hypothetical protein